MTTGIHIAKFTDGQLDKLFADAYYKAVISGADMLQVATLLEPLRQSINTYPPMQAWSLVTLDRDQFDKSPFIKMLVDIRDEYYRIYAGNIIQMVKQSFKKGDEEGWQTWLINYVEALMLSTPDVFDAMCVADITFPEKYLSQKEKYCKLNKFLVQSRWVDCYETSIELSTIEWLYPQQRARLLIFAGQIYMYWFPDSRLAKKHFDEADTILKGSEITERGYAEYYKQMGDFEEARNHLINAQIKSGQELNNLLLSGDISKDQGLPEMAEGKYNEAIARNFIDPDAYPRLVSLYANPAMFNDKKSLIESLVQKVGSLESGYPVRYDFYNANRDAGFAFSLNHDYKTSESYYSKAIAMQPLNTAAIIDLAYIFAYQQKYKEAEAYFFKAIEIDDKTFEAYWGLGWVYSQQKDIKKAQQYYEQCLALRPSWSGLIHYTIGIMYEDADDIATAGTHYEMAVAANPSAEYLSQLAGIYEKQNKIQEAIAAYEKATTLNAKDALAWNKLGNLYFGLDDFTKAKLCYQHSADIDATNIIYVKNLGLADQKSGKWDESIISYSKALQLKSDDAEALNSIGIAYYETRNYEKAITFYKRAIEAAKNVSGNKNEFVYWANIGLAFRDDQNYVEAEKAYLQSLSLNPASVDNQNYAGILYYMMKEYPKAIEHYKKALDLKPDAQLYENIALAYSENNENDAAILNFNEAIKLNPSAHITINYLGNVYFKLADYSKARAQYMKAVELQPQNTIYLSNAGLTYYFDKLYKDALPFFDKALSYGPDYLPALNYGGNCNIVLGDYETAEARYRKCISLNPQESIYFSNLGISLIQLRRFPEAEEYLMQAISLDENNQEAASNLGFIAYKKEDLGKAKEYFLKAFPGSVEDPVSYYEYLYPEESKETFEKTTGAASE